MTDTQLLDWIICQARATGSVRIAEGVAGFAVDNGKNTVASDLNPRAAIRAAMIASPTEQWLADFYRKQETPR